MPSEFDHSPKAANCDACPLSGVRKVGSKGPWDSPIVIVGEGPGKVELIKGQPFVGPSGSLLGSCWPDHLDYDIDQVFMINAMQCSIFGATKQADDADQKLTAATRACHDRVITLLGLAPRRLIFGMGKWANMSLKNEDDCKITKIRGELYDFYDPVYGTSCKVMPTIHPAAMLRGFGNVNHFKSDLTRGMEYALGKEMTGGFTAPVVKELATAANVLDLHKYILDLHEYHEQPILLHTDIETTGFRFHSDRILCIGIYIDERFDDSNAGWVIDWDRIRIEAEAFAAGHIMARPFFDAVKALLEIPAVAALYDWQNGKFDYKFLHHKGIKVRIDEDTFLLDVTLDERPGGHDLDEIAKNKLGAPNHKHVIKQWVTKPSDSYELIPKPNLWEYLATDVKKTGNVWGLLHDEVMEDENNRKLYTQTLLPASTTVARVEMRGICVDTFVRAIEYKDFAGETKVHEGTYITLNQMQYAEEMGLAQKEVSELAGYWVNPNSPQQVKELLYERLGLKLKGKKPKDTTKETLDKLPPHPVVKAIRRFRRLSKVLGTYINTIPKHLAPDGRIHSTYNLGGTRTGRLASSEPNVQNIPREGRIRRMYCAPPGRELTEGDYNTAELRMLAALSRDVFLTEVFLDDKRNLHDEVAVSMYGENWTADERIRAKAINFGIPYGRESFSIAAEFDITTTEAQRLIDAWFARAPEATAFLARCRRAPSAGQTLINAFGRKCRPGVVSAERLHAMENEFCNFFMQSTINEFGLHSAMELDYKLEKLDSGIVNLVHDSLLVENPPAARKEVVALMRHHMEGIPKLWIKTPIVFSVDFKHMTYWGMPFKGEGK